ncbi:hypothetical protein MRX96_056423 [Rhipicephalus microplus]
MLNEAEQAPCGAYPTLRMAGSGHLDWRCWRTNQRELYPSATSSRDTRRSASTVGRWVAVRGLAAGHIRARSCRRRLFSTESPASLSRATDCDAVKRPGGHAGAPACGTGAERSGPVT